MRFETCKDHAPAARWLALLPRVVTVVVLIGLATNAMAQPSATTLTPRSCFPGKTTRVSIVGKGFVEPMRVVCNRADIALEVVATEAEKWIVDVTVPKDASLGPVGLWLASEAGPTQPIVLMIDDLPPVAETSDNVSVDTAQPVERLNVVEGFSKGPQASYFRLEVDQEQRVAFEILTQPLESKMDPVVRLIDQEGKTLVLADDDQVGPDCRFAYQFPQAGTYWIEVRDNRYTTGLPYHLRIGDFPILRHAIPPVVQADTEPLIAFAGQDGDQAVSQQRHWPASLAGQVVTISTRLADGQSSAWVPLLVTPTAVESETATSADDAASGLAAPITIAGRLTQPGEVDRFPIAGTQATTVRFKARERSLGCPTTLKMRLLGDADQVLAESKVTDADEWSFEFTFPEDRTYHLEVSDLLGRGGVDFGYAVEILAAATFALNLKPDAAATLHHAIETGHGAAAIDIQVQRFGYAGEIELTLVDSPPGIRILNPRVGENVKEVRLYLAVDENWTDSAAGLIKLGGHAVGDPGIRAPVESLAWHRVKTPHVPFPIHWNSGQWFFSGVAPAEAFFALEPAEPIRFARPVPRHETTLNVKRLQEAFKAPLVVMANPDSTDWPAQISNEGDVYKVAWTRPNETPPSTPPAFSLLAYAEHQKRGRLSQVQLPVQWFEPATVTLRPADQDLASGKMPKPLVAGTTANLVVDVVRDGDDPQPLTLTFPGAAELGFTLTDSLVIAPDQSSATVAVAVSADVAAASPIRLPFLLKSSYQGQAFQQNLQSQPLAVIAAPRAIEVFPTEMNLTDARDRHQIVVTGYDAENMPRDWTREATISSADPLVAAVRGTAIFAQAAGETRITVEVGSHRVEVPVRVAATDSDRPIAFENEVLVALSKQGCNSGACHGSPSGKGMFRLSLRAFDRQLDELTLIREDYGRRLNPIEPQESLLLLKPLMKITHGGGRQLKVTDEAYSILKDWIAGGAPADPVDAPRCVRLEVLPGQKRMLRLEDGPQQIAAIAHFSDGTQRDVTHLVAYESSDMSIATVDHAGLVTPSKRGETVILVRFLEHIESVPLMFIQQNPEFVWAAPAPVNYVDQHVNEKLRQLQFLPAETCTDAEFLRRAYLDVVGVLPTVEATRAFLADQSTDKRERLIDDLLERDEFAKFWALKWGDLLKMTGKVVGDDGVFKYHRWVEEAFRNNMPYDQFATELLTTSGSTLANPPANFYRTATDMNECVENVSQVFLGARLQCAKCHNHPFERWTQDNYYGLGAFFHRIQRRKTERPGEMFVWSAESGDVVQPRTGEKMKPWLPAQGSLDLPESADRRDAFAKWLIEPTNPYFAKMEVNRIWAQLFARGIVDPIDDFRDSNPPSNEALLDALAADFVESGFDRRHILRVIMNSRTYQASYQTNRFNQDDTQYFSHQRPRLLGAEQLLDAINHATGLDQPFGNLPPGTRATHLPAPDLVKVDFLRVFGQPERTTVCACERVDDSNLGMAIELFNGTTIHEKLRDPKTRFRVALAQNQPLADVIQELYLATMCRYPTDEELQAAISHCQQRNDVAAGLEDVCWALLNTDEFLFQH